MSLPLLVGGSAECGPSANNPLRSLTKNLDKDRGVHQDLLGPNRAGSSGQTFRTHSNHVSTENLREAANFFSGSNSATLLNTPSSPFDFANLGNALPVVNHRSPQVPMMQQTTQPNLSGAAWASDFMNFQQIQPNSSSKQVVATSVRTQNAQQQTLQNPVGMFSPVGMNGNFPFVPHPAGMSIQFPNAVQEQQSRAEVAVKRDSDRAWDHFLSDLVEEPQPMEKVQPAPTQISEGQQQRQVADPAEQDALARTAGKLVDALREEQNPKFKNSQFMGLMRSLADRTSVVEGNDIVSSSSSLGNTTSTSTDVKGKGKERDATVGTFGQTTQVYPSSANIGVTFDGQPSSSSYAQGQTSDTPNTSEVTQDSYDEVYEYFKQENEDYISYQRAAKRVADPNQGIWDVSSQQLEWDKLQDEWDAWEANAVGVRKMSNYRFTAENPYLLESSTRVHEMHSSFDQMNTLELEAVVQRDTKNVQAWFALGVKQQDSEREQKAIDALHRAVELDPEYVPAWLALGVSHTNETNRAKAYGAIREWVKRHPRFPQTIVGMNGGFQDEVFEPGSERSQKAMYEGLIACLIEIARDVSDKSEGEQGIDPDVQIALAVLLNSNEEYAKATDCFLTALAVRPHDWALFNRVGATLANSGNADSALEYYYRALELNPVYIRARFNLGISCINLHRYEEAARHVLDALTLQNSDAMGDPRGGVTSDALWNCLESVCGKIGRLDIIRACGLRDIDSLRMKFETATSSG